MVFGITICMKVAVSGGGRFLYRRHEMPAP